MNKTIKFSDLEQLLIQKLAFQEMSTVESHIFEHAPSGTLIPLPPLKAEESVPLYHLVGIRRLIDERGITSAATFDKLLEEAVLPLAAK